MSLRNLDQLEETITSLAGYLILAHKNHGRFILGEPGYQPTQASARKLRLTQHYVTALLAYGFPPSVPELRWAAEWFATPFSGTKHDQIDELELTQLEGLLNLRPDDPGVGARLKQLLNQRNGRFFEIVNRDEGHGNRDPVFDTLWSLKLLIMGRQRGALTRGISEREITRMLSDLMPLFIHDKDLALALRLAYELNNKLDHEAEMLAMVGRAQDYGNLWGVVSANRWERLKPIYTAMERSQLTPHVIESEAKLFRDILLHTCYVLENLSALAHLHPDVEAVLQASMGLWWRQFNGENAPIILRSLFVEEYDFLMILCRTMVATNTYAGVPLAAQAWQGPLREMAQTRFVKKQAAEMKDFKRALRQWIAIDFPESAVKPLKLGLSEASVYRIEPHLYNPTDDRRLNLLNGTSLVVKAGPEDQIEQERRRYAELPRRARDLFVRMPTRTAFVNRQHLAYVIMEDLSDFYTLFEIFEQLLKPDRPRLGAQLSEFLLTMHRGSDDAPGLATSNHVRELYLLPILRHLEFVAASISKAQLLLDGRLGQFQDLEASIDRSLGVIMHHQRKFGRFPLALMHGDLHSRNIMIRIVQSEGVTRRDADLVFKLIDLESLNMAGDAAHDAGQLLVDLNLLQVTSQRSLNRQVVEKLDAMQTIIQDAYLTFADERDDSSFALRLELARARALIRIAKGRTKRSEAFQKDREFQRVVDELVDAINLIEAAESYLGNVARSLESS